MPNSFLEGIGMFTNRLAVVLFTLLLALSRFTHAGESPQPPVEIPGIVCLSASQRVSPPEWAVLERRLISAMEEAAPYYLERFTRRGGTPYGDGPYDDVYEMFFNWPLFYAMGADEKMLNWAVTEFNAITRHCTVFDPVPKDYHHQLYKEFPEHDDWFHISEGMMAFYDFGVADPTIPENIARARRFAGFYMNEDPEAKNFDPERKLVPAIFTGSKGPAEHVDGTYALRVGHVSLHPVIGNLEEDWYARADRRREILDIFDTIATPCDVPINLGIAGLMTNAYLYTGEKKYKAWVIDYVNAWMERIRENNGIIPDNVGRSGKIGEYRNGQWWGGFFGWTAVYSVHMIHGALSVASECAQLLTGDVRYLNLLRSQLDVLLNESITTAEGQMLVPYQYGPGGWTSYRPMIIRDLAHLWHASMDPADGERIKRVMDGQKFYPLPYSWPYPKDMWKKGAPFSWDFEPSFGDRDDNNSAEYPRFAYYAGENSDWPAEILKADYREVQRRMDAMRKDPRSIYAIQGDGLYVNNPVITKGLQQVTMGAPQSIYNGGLLRARVRYFDADRRRPGMPPDVAALVEKINRDNIVVKLVNLSVKDTRNVILHAGAFGEHEFTHVSMTGLENGDEAGKTVVNESYFMLTLPPGAGVTLTIGMKLHANQASYAFPWHGGSVPAK